MLSTCSLHSLEPRLSVPDFVSQLRDKIQNYGEPGFEASLVPRLLVGGDIECRL